MDLWDARLQLHWAAQPAAGVGRTVLPKQADFSHESFQWSPKHGALLQGLIMGSDSLRSGIRLRDMTLLLVNDRDEIVDELPVSERSLMEAYDFYEERLGARIARPPEGIPQHPVVDGAPFGCDQEHLDLLHRLYAEAYEQLSAVAEREPEAGPVRCWPHHFDIATLIMLGGSGEDARTIGAGMAPGDEGIRDPYYYVTPWPRPEVESIPALAAGRWNTRGWFGAVLPALEPRATVSAFLEEAVRKCRSLMSGS